MKAISTGLINESRLAVARVYNREGANTGTEFGDAKGGLTPFWRSSRAK
jgi:hypothetical protein